MKRNRWGLNAWHSRCVFYTYACTLVYLRSANLFRSTIERHSMQCRTAPGDLQQAHGLLLAGQWLSAPTGMKPHLIRGCCGRRTRTSRPPPLDGYVCTNKPLCVEDRVGGKKHATERVTFSPFAREQRARVAGARDTAIALNTFRFPPPQG